jgi:ATP-dependent helicase/nuclease subunit B
VGALLQLTAGMMDGRADPVAALSVLKHRLVRLGRTSEALWRERGDVERYGLRGARPRDWNAVRDRLEREGERRHAEHLKAGRTEEAAETIRRFEAAAELVDDLEETLADACAVFVDGGAEVAVAARAHAEMLEALAEDPRAGSARCGGVGRRGGGGAVHGPVGGERGMPPVTPSGYAELVARMVSGETVRAGGGAHPGCGSWARSRRGWCGRTG